MAILGTNAAAERTITVYPQVRTQTKPNRNVPRFGMRQNVLKQAYCDNCEINVCSAAIIQVPGIHYQLSICLLVELLHNWPCKEFEHRNFCKAFPHLST